MRYGRSPQGSPDLFREPVFVIGCNRSGTTLLFRILSAHFETWSLYIEARQLFYEYFPVDPEEGDRVTDALSPRAVESLKRDLYNQAHNKQRFKSTPVLWHLPAKLFQKPLGVLYKRPPIRLVEKTPSNCFRIPLLASLFPDARFIYVVRRGEAVVSSLMEGWCRWTGVEKVEEWKYSEWHYLVPPNWKAYRDRPLEEICAFQWIMANGVATADLERHCAERYLLVRHEDTLEDPVTQYQRILRFCNLPYCRRFDGIVRQISSHVFTTGGSAPEREKWKRLHGQRIMRVRHRIEPMNARLYGSSGPASTG